MYKNLNNQGDESGRPPTNHWVIFLQLRDSVANSVKVDMIPGDGADGLAGTVILDSKEYVVTNASIMTLTFKPTEPVTLQAIMDLIVKNKRDKYRFTDEEGCRYWMYTLISDLEAGEILAQGSATTAWASISLYWRDPSGSEPRMVERGTF